MAAALVQGGVEGLNDGSGDSGPGLTRQDSDADQTSKSSRRLSVSRAMAAAGTFKRNMSLTSSTRSSKAAAEVPGTSPSTSPTPSENGDQWETMSNVSTTSKSSKVSSLIAGMKSIGRRSSTGRAVATPSAPGLSSEEVLPGDSCTAIGTVTVRGGEDLDSEELAQLPAGTLLQILEVSGRRAKVSAGSLEGWISKATRLNEPLVRKQSAAAASVHCDLKDPAVGTKYEAKVMLAVHTEASSASEVKAKLKPGTVFSVLELCPIDRYRVKMSARMVTGWLSLVAADGKVAVGEASENSLGQDGVVFMPKFMKIKCLLEAAVAGDVQALKKVCEEKDGWFSSSSSSRVDLNCGDIRGKTALMYAAGLGHKSMVEFLLDKKEVGINILDDTQKTALHHATKRGGKRRPNEDPVSQSDIVFLLLQHGIQIEAKDHNGCTPIMFAAANGDEAVTRKLMLANACLNVKDYEGHTPMDYAINFSQHAIVDMLRCSGALGQMDFSGAASDEDPSEPGLSEAPTTLPQDRPAGPPQLATASASGSGGGSAGEEAKPKLKKKKSVAAAEADGEAAAAGDGAEGDKKLKKKKISAKAKPTKQESKDVSAGMMEAMMHQEEEVGQVTVEATPEAEDEVVDERQRALAKLATLLESSPAAGELDATIKAAMAAGAEEADLTEAKAVLKELTARDKAREKLRQSINDRDVGRLQAAIAKAQDAKVPSKYIEDARKVLAEEEPKQQARELLSRAREVCDIEQLKVALVQAKRVGLNRAELVEFEELLAGVESKDKAEAMLRVAMQDKNIADLKFAIKQANEVGVDAEQIKEAKAVLKEEEPKQQARDLLAAACEQNSIDLLQDAIAAALSAKLEGEPLLKEAQSQLRKEQKKMELLGAVKQAMQDAVGIDMTSIDFVRQGKDRLSDAIEAAIAGGAAEADLAEAEIRRKKLHNTIEDLKGAIRVFCRVRPLSSKEKEQGDVQAVRATGALSLEVDGGNPFQFDAVFTPGSQDEVFEDCRDLVQSAVDGYNVTMFAYGQTGAGKTFTMYGVPGAEGTAPRTIDEIFQVIDKRKSRFSYTVMGSMLELYNNELLDLLAKGTAGASKTKLNVKVEKSGFVSVENLVEQECKTAQELRSLLERGEKQRTVAATAMNSESSRSHLVLMITIVSVNYETKERLRGKVLICDLAGSERLKKSQVSEDMQKEAIEINKSLTALGDVIEALTQGSKLVPYRNHKLTLLMQDALGGSAKTLMFVNCSPASSNVQETLMSLKYATRAKKITNGVAKKGT